MYGDKRGFTLIELAIVLAVTGIIMVMGVTAARTMRQAAELKEMALDAALAYRAVESFTVIQQRLPSKKEFAGLGLPENRKGHYIYHINPALKTFYAPEQYCGYKYGNAGRMPSDPVKSATVRPYAYAVDFVSDNGAPIFRHLKSYDDFLTDLGCKMWPDPN